jgi:hypothetical protein
MIPKNINREHIIKAIEEIKKVGIPDGRSSRKYFLEYNGEYYPPKYLISLSNKYANGKELDPQEFNGGAETNNYLRDLGFKIVKASSKCHIIKPHKENRKKKVSTTYHNERCPKCKETIKNLLKKIYGKVEQNYRFEIETDPEDFKNMPYYNQLKEIYESLQNYRGFKEFVKSKTLPNCDFFIPNQWFIVEFDETQHFTEPRRIALENYPEKLELGFDRERWIELCKRIKAKDNDPPYRDEQRAWYDTLRDFLPTIKGLKPTVRLFAKDYVWCSFNPNNSSDVERFENILKGTSGRWEIEVRKEQNPSIARVIIAGEWEGNPIKARQLLEDICNKWPKGRKVKFLITCGGSVQFDWPKSISRNDIGDNKNPNQEVVKNLIAKAEEYVNSVLNKDLCRKLSEVTDYITLGIDSFKEKISTTQNYISQPHIELVFLKVLRQDKLYWTGKSYPTPAQQKGLVRIANLKTHFFDLDIGKVMILGCHDLSIFNPRSKNAKGWRRKVNDDFKELAKKEKPTYVLHHPHTTVKRRTWLNAWSYLRKILPSVKQYAGSGRYYESDRERSKWDTLDKVIKNTKNTDTIDFIVWDKKTV